MGGGANDGRASRAYLCPSGEQEKQQEDEEVRSAGEGVKAAAQHIVGTNAEDGWVEAMERFVLDRL